MFWLTLIIMFVATVFGSPETHRLVKVQDGVDIPQDIVYDEAENTVLITVAPVPELGKLVPTINFHDYNTGYVAFKDVKSTKCYLSYPPIPVPTPGIYRMKRTYMTLASTAVVDGRAMSPEEVGEMAGERIRDFCEDYATHWMDLKKVLPGRTKRSTELMNDARKEYTHTVKPVNKGHPWQRHNVAFIEMWSFFGACWFNCGTCIVEIII